MRVRSAVNNVITKVMRYLVDYEDENLELQSIQLTRLFNKLRTYNVCSNITKLVQVRLYDSTFLEKLNNNNDILTVKNRQIVDLKTRTVRIRV